MFWKNFKVLYLAVFFSAGCKGNYGDLQGILWYRLSAYDVKTGNKIYSAPVDEDVLNTIRQKCVKQPAEEDVTYDPVRHTGLVSQNGRWALVIYFFGPHDTDSWDYCVFDVFETSKGKIKNKDRRRIGIEGVVSAYPAVSNNGEYVAFLRDRKKLYYVDTKTKEEKYILDVPETKYGGMEVLIYWQDKHSLILRYKSKTSRAGRRMTISVDIQNLKIQRLLDSYRIIFVPDYGYYNEEGRNIFKCVRNKIRQLPPSLKQLIVQTGAKAVSPCHHWVVHQEAKMLVPGISKDAVILERVTGETKELKQLVCSAVTEGHMRWTGSFRVGDRSKERTEE